ncbi:hypothetical protein T440DRAFT_212443 [Plenodomus tracheiphilus IPT5]|uniref:Uncharacterized protein n=1 Tax=Plenodomus tracheiphilus IPT5 TaxID=1408161 RepID=A0A6A7AW72_9PLEO|nr:hypothetical protein T440DRAFT_212443 [Plenodomus tracheiphilus IPT5]
MAPPCPSPKGSRAHVALDRNHSALVSLSRGSIIIPRNGTTVHRPSNPGNNTSIGAPKADPYMLERFSVVPSNVEMDVDPDSVQRPLDLDELDFPKMTEKDIRNLHPIEATVGIARIIKPEQRLLTIRLLFCEVVRQNENAKRHLLEHLETLKQKYDFVRSLEMEILLKLQSDWTRSQYKPQGRREFRIEYQRRAEEFLYDYDNKAWGKFRRAVKAFHRKMHLLIQHLTNACRPAPSIQEKGAEPVPSSEDLWNQLKEALHGTVKRMNVEVSHSHNNGVLILNLDRPQDMGQRLEQWMLNDLAGKLGPSLSEQQQHAAYVEAGNALIENLMNTDFFITTVRQYLSA